MQNNKMNNGIDLTHLTTFRLPFCAKAFFSINHIQDCEKLPWLLPHYQKYFVLGGGANTIATPFFDGIVLKINTKGIAIEQNDSHFFIHIQAGENWADLVLFLNQQGIVGLENLAGIPGELGGAIVQNIGAYGVELKHFVQNVVALNLKTFQTQVFTQEECAFSYRHSIFKEKLYLITSATLRIPKRWQAQTHYADLKNIFKNQTLTPQKILQAVLNARQNKLPNPQILPNAGSFFKNPIIHQKDFFNLQKKLTNLPFWKQNDFFKISAAYLIEQAGLKGVFNHNQTLGVFPQHALILVHYWNAQHSATRKDLNLFTQHIQQTIWQKFGIVLEPEPVFMPD